MKVVDTREYVSVLRELVEEGREVNMVVWGSSMTPFLGHGRDTIFFAAPERELRRGDMVFYQRDTGQFVIHRIWKVKKYGYYIVGDAQTIIEGPIRRDQIFARITKVNRKGKMISNGDFWWEFFEKVWIRMVPLRPVIMKFYSVVSGRRNS